MSLIRSKVKEENFIDPNSDPPKRYQNIPSIQLVRNYINDLISDSNIDTTSIPVQPISPQMPQWEHKKGKSDTDYTDSNKLKTHSIHVIM